MREFGYKVNIGLLRGDFMNFDSYIILGTKTALSVPMPQEILPKKKTFKQKAFTLAETLITLSIIGVIAAMTVPTLVSNAQKASYVAGVKKAYSQLNNALRMIPVTEGCSAGDYECAGFFKYASGQHSSSGGWSTGDNENFAERFEFLAKQFKTISINTPREKINNSHACYGLLRTTYAPGNFVTTDGMCFASSYGLYAGGNNLIVYVDVNGAKNPNIGGRDQFLFYISDKTFDNTNQVTVVPNGSGTTGNWESTCKTFNKRYGNFSCTARVLKENAMNY